MIAKAAQLGPFHLFFTLSCAEMRWPEVFINILKDFGITVIKYGNDKFEWNGQDDRIFVEDENGEDVPLMEFVERLPQSKHELLRDSVVLITRIFDNRVKAFITEILKKKGKHKVPFAIYSYRVEFQARGLPHIHGVLWIENEWLVEEFGKKYKYTKNSSLEESDKRIILDLAEKLISCEIPSDDVKLADQVEKLQNHRCRNSCQKKNVESKTCRYGFPKLLSERTLLAEPLDMADEQERETKLKEYQDTLIRAKEVLTNADPTKDMSFSEYLEKIGINETKYYEALSHTVRGKVLVLKRSFKERNINNYNKEWMQVWDANMDIQLVFDTFAVITYVVNYVGKDESGMTKHLKDCLKDVKDLPYSEKLNALKMKFVTHRQNGASEAIYKILPGMHLKNSTVGCIFIPTGFPENRNHRFDPIKNSDVTEDDYNHLDDNEDDDRDDNDDTVDINDDFHNANPKEIKIPGRIGRFKPVTSMIDIYQNRPDELKDMCLAQFATYYSKVTKVKSGTEWNKNGTASTNISDKHEIFSVMDDPPSLPKYIKLETLPGIMKLKDLPMVLRFHNSKKKEGHEQHYAELFLFCPWKNEEKDIPRDMEKCINKYLEQKHIIDNNRNAMFPAGELLDLDTNLNLDEMRPTHIYDKLDAQGEQNNEDDLEIGIEEDPEFVGRNIQLVNSNLEGNFSTKDSRYPKISPPNTLEEMYDMTRKLVQEQQRALTMLLKYLKDVIIQRKNPLHNIDPLKLIIHGGAGVGKSYLIKILSLVAEMKLRQAGQSSDCPNVLVCAPTGKAAYIIGGTTIHGGFNFEFTVKDYNSLTDKKLAEMREGLKNLKLIIIDEMSMVSADIFCKIHRRLSELHYGTDDAFANIGMILVGDLLQLKPIMAKYIFESPNDKKNRQLYQVLKLWNDFKVIVLKHNHRQGEGNQWTELLNRVRIGKPTPEDLQLLQSRLTEIEYLDPAISHVFRKNEDVTYYNLKILNTFNTTLVQTKAQHFGPKGYVPFITKDGRVNKTGYDDILSLKTEAKVSLLVNLSTPDGLVNGAVGTVVGFEKRQGKIDCVIVSFEDTETGELQRQRHPRESVKYRTQNGTPIFFHEQEYRPQTKKNGVYHSIRAKLIQIPLKLSWATTAHRIQVYT